MKVLHLRTKTAGYVDVKDYCIGVDIGDDKALANEISNFIDGKDYSNMIQSAYKMVQKNCTVEAMTNQIFAIYQNVIEE